IASPSSGPMAISTMRRRCSSGEVGSPRLCGGRGATENKTRSRPSERRAACAMATCPVWGGSEGPPITPLRSPAHSAASLCLMACPLDLVFGVMLHRVVLGGGDEFRERLDGLVILRAVDQDQALQVHGLLPVLVVRVVVDHLVAVDHRRLRFLAAVV